jgi:hypothetical protein
MLELKSHPEGVILPVQAQPGARRNGIVGLHAGRLKVAVTQVAEKGKANQELARVLAADLGLRRGQCELIAGETSSQKQFLIRGETMDSLQGRLKAILES